MRIVAHLSKYYDWVPVPADVVVTKADLDADRVRHAAAGGYRMRVTKPSPSYCEIGLPEEQVIAKIIHEKCRPEGGRIFTRKEAVAYYLAENVLPHHGRAAWLTKFEIHDDGPDEAKLLEMLAPHAVAEADRVKDCIRAVSHQVVSGVAGAPERCETCGHMPSIGEPATEPNIPADDQAAHVAAYLEPLVDGALLAHLHSHFRIKASDLASKAVQP